ncbi:hypothetical protein IU418_26475 [Nocardia farcinica]|uniref:hypothetical protein n=1 Tax=Nocardia farcinica TaxID=37329 RepID=UPI001B3C6E2C|nr:hypothetical protein [Nocardia farcinica]MBF6540757.1 hypothetical protein [Nocardia farcinica]
MTTTLSPATDADVLAALALETTAAWTLRFFDGRDDIMTFDAAEAEELAAYYESECIGLVLIAPARDTAEVDAPDTALVDAPDTALVDAPDTALVDVLGPIAPAAVDPWTVPAPALSGWTARHDGYAAIGADGVRYHVTHWGALYALMVTAPGGTPVKVTTGLADALRSRATEIATARHTA